MFLSPSKQIYGKNTSTIFCLNALFFFKGGSIFNKRERSPLDFTPSQSFSSHFLIHGETRLNQKKVTPIIINYSSTLKAPAGLYFRSYSPANRQRLLE